LAGSSSAPPRAAKSWLSADGAGAGQLSAALAAKGDLPRGAGAPASFYAHFGFTPVTEVYDEDGIPHIGMARESRAV
jgi:ElaA protein